MTGTGLTELLSAYARLEREAHDAAKLAADLGMHFGPLRAALDDLTALHQRGGPTPAPAPRAPAGPRDGQPIRACVLDDPHDPHERTNGKWCPGIDEDEADR